MSVKPRIQDLVACGQPFRLTLDNDGGSADVELRIEVAGVARAFVLVPPTGPAHPKKTPQVIHVRAQDLIQIAIEDWNPASSGNVLRVIAKGSDEQEDKQTLA